MAYYRSHDPKWWRGRNDGKEADRRRWHQVVQSLNYDKTGLEGYAILGFECDEGVRRNLGRTGAAEGPAAIRSAMGSLPAIPGVDIYDAGTILCDSENLEGAQRLVSRQVARIIRTGVTPVLLGGGHEISWPHYEGLVRARPDHHVGIINFDAHFDLRQPSDETGHSGTPFSQIAEFQHARNGAFDYLVFGIQRAANTEYLFKRADKLNVEYFLAGEFDAGRLPVMEKAVRSFASRVDHIYLTVDMDVFSAAAAPGVSAVNPLGIAPNSTVTGLLRSVTRTGKLLSMDIAETNPSYDIDGRTAKLAAWLVFEILSEKNS